MPEDPELPDGADEDSTVIRDLRARAKEADAAVSERDQLRRENVVLRAGLNDLTDKQLKALTAAHDGDWEPDALKATATELGFGKQTETVEEPQVPAGELESMRRMQDASRGEPPPVEGDLESRLQQAKNPQEVMAILAEANMLSMQ